MNSIRTLKLATLIALTILLTACGGGGGGGSEQGTTAPSELNATADTNGGIELSWQAVSDADSYTIYWSTSLDIDTTAYIDKQNTTETSLSLDGLNILSDYYFVVTAHKDSKESSISNIVSSTPVIAIQVGDRLWLDRNLGASRVCTATTDSECFGDLYQWGRDTDGHEKCTRQTGDETCRSGSSITSVQSTSDTPNHSDFITHESNWRSSVNDQLWIPADGNEINNPCPTGYRVPTFFEFEIARIISWQTSDLQGAFMSPLKIPANGIRKGNNGSLASGIGSYYTSTVFSGSPSLVATVSIIDDDFNLETFGRSSASAIRCIDNALPDPQIFSGVTDETEYIVKSEQYDWINKKLTITAESGWEATIEIQIIPDTPYEIDASTLNFLWKESGITETQTVNFLYNGENVGSWEVSVTWE